MSFPHPFTSAPGGDREPAKVLTIGGSDSGGAAGLQADLKTFTALGVYGMSVVTVVTAQNSVSVEAVQSLPAGFVAAQLEAVLSDYGAAAVKTGFIGRVDLIETVAAGLRARHPGYSVIDPVLVNHRGQPMFAPEVTRAYRELLLPLADLVTPNKHEAALLADSPLPEQVTPRWLSEVARCLHALGPRYVLVKGGRKGEEMVDVLYDGERAHLLRAKRIETRNTHGSGDTLSAAVCAYLAQGETMETAVRQARQFTLRAIQRAAYWQLGRGHGPVSHW
ncbi:MAG: bifunctional hydroxymethylpyrimidine kinase/phosphomethylpyrimidine kinase [Anaerolineae bacterium]